MSRNGVVVVGHCADPGLAARGVMPAISRLPRGFRLGSLEKATVVVGLSLIAFSRRSWEEKKIKRSLFTGQRLHNIFSLFIFFLRKKKGGGWFEDCVSLNMKKLRDRGGDIFKGMLRKEQEMPRDDEVRLL